ncbi:Uncharacterized conserved protein YlxW, UPF0749 family [Jatrophihabitans endophyticus]|uniref:Uncharacterized conserved protein YlxW, UPF0749 family n=1 Tax=Jatrophihabitans endophyticus TaxID=1206085 RepID=A0A1M5MRV9_9ACTN|nr:DUF881 domain-containing protein [Jatrophihabitans endophyticus]SHG79792.1 Uncharacterized conserved protein YlxW, UPF0749 family [Jatrophihabitans endophyticus]
MSDDPTAGEPADEPAEPVESVESVERDRPRPRRGWRHNRHASAAVIGVLTLVLGFAIAVQVQANSGEDSLSGLREDDLIGILDNQNARADRLRRQIAELQETLNRLKDSGDRSAAARQQARQEAQALGVLLGTLPATGPGVVVAVTDPRATLTGEDLLDVVQELRGAGAEAIEFGAAGGTVRVSTTTAFGGGDGGQPVTVDGITLRAPYRVVAIGDATTLDTALNIPGGIAATVRAAGGELTVAERARVTITVTRALPVPTHAKPR